MNWNVDSLFQYGCGGSCLWISRHYSPVCLPRRFENFCRSDMEMFIWFQWNHFVRNIYNIDSPKASKQFLTCADVHRIYVFVCIRLFFLGTFTVTSQIPPSSSGRCLVFLWPYQQSLRGLAVSGKFSGFCPIWVEWGWECCGYFR